MPAIVLQPVATLDDVLARLDEIVDRARRDRDRLGYFACLYRSVTRRVRDGIRESRFEDGARMERFDVLFANRYFTALAAHRGGERSSRSWDTAFGAARAGHLLVLQHLLLGMNAHINLDLGIAAAQTAPGAALPGLRRDFFEITRLLAEMLDEAQHKLARVSPWIGVLDTLGCRTDEAVFAFALGRARDVAWRVANCMATTPPERIPFELERVDRAAALIAHPVRYPGLHLMPALLAVRARESSDVAEVLAALA